MDPIDRTAPLIEVLRRRMAANLDRLERDGKLVTTRPQIAPASPPDARQRRRTLQQRLDALDQRDPRFAERAADVFVESVLLAEFGEGLINDANFRQLILEVSRELRDEADTSRRLGELFKELRSK